MCRAPQALQLLMLISSVMLIIMNVAHAVLIAFFLFNLRASRGASPPNNESNKTRKNIVKYILWLHLLFALCGVILASTLVCLLGAYKETRDKSPRVNVAYNRSHELINFINIPISVRDSQITVNLLLTTS